MAPVLPSSLSPHICILPSPDLTDLLESSSLPPLASILQSFSPLPSVTTRTTTLTDVPHTSFALRFSDLAEIETACKEDEEQRAVRTIDWMGERINKRSAKWVEDMEKANEKDVLRTPWWDELRRCAEGDHIPSRVESWNHPAAIILAVSTTAPNPLQAITALHSRVVELPAWVDPVYLRYTLIIHPQSSPLSDEEAGALFNAVKKQFGLHSYLLRLALPTPSPPPVPVPTLIPRLPPPVSNDDAESSKMKGSSGPVVNALRMDEEDIQHTARFTREFVVQSLVPWMEKCVNDWNEIYSSTRRLPSRLFTSTRRLFGTSSPSNAPHTPLPQSIPSTRSHNYNGSQSSISGAPSPNQQRRLAEFATILGDFKLAVSVWESLRKEGKGGSEVLPLLLSPSPAIQLHAQNALMSIHPPSPELPAHAQLRGLIYAVRWEMGIASSEFLSSVLEGERWLVWAAGNAEEPPSALLLAHAAFLSARKHARRRAALWYLFAANRLEKCGFKPLTMYFLRKAHGLYKCKPERILSPSFWDSEGKSADDRSGFDAIMPVIEHPLGRLLYTTGDVGGAVRFFLGLLHGSDHLPVSITSPKTNGEVNGDLKSLGTDKVFLEDFRVAFAHFKTISPDDATLSDLRPPFTFCVVRHTRVRLPRASMSGSPPVWEKREEDWNAFWKARGGEPLDKSGKAAMDETFWVDLAIQNPLDTEVNLSNLTVTVREITSTDSKSAMAYVDIEVIDDIILGAKETRTIPISITSSCPGFLTITHVTYEFLSLLPASESLASRGPRLQETAIQRQAAAYGSDLTIDVEVEEASQKLLASFVDDSRLVLVQGECKRMSLWLSNAGTRNVDEVWMVVGAEDEIWVDFHSNSAASSTNLSPTEILHSINSILPQQPFRIPLDKSLLPGDSVEFSVILHADQVSEHDLCLLFVFREAQNQSFHSARATRYYEVAPIFDVSVSSQASRSAEHLFLLNLELNNISPSSTVQLTQVTTLSPLWQCTPVVEDILGPLSPSQNTRLLFGAHRWEGSSDLGPILDFIRRKLSDVLHGHGVDASLPPEIDLLCSHTRKTKRLQSLNESSLRHFITSGQRNFMSRLISAAHPHIPARSHPSIFPLYNSSSVDAVVFWEIPSQQRSGHLLIPGITFGAGHAALKEIIDDAEGIKVKRNMYAETQREKNEILDAVRRSEWNAEMNPIVVTLQHGHKLEHDFTQGVCHVQAPFILRNLSLTHTSRFVLKLDSNAETRPISSDFLPPQYSGRLTFRGTLKPTQIVRLYPKVCITRPGAYALGGWCLETEVGETVETSAWRTRQRYVQGPPMSDRACITVTDVANIKVK